MRRETWDVLVDCVDCGSPVDSGIGRGYRVSDKLGLCLPCALKRGGSFDEDDDIWMEPPDITGIDPDVEHKYR